MKRIFERYPHTLMAALLVAVGLASMAWGERLSANGGLGWDGQFYVALVKNFYESVFVNHMDNYHVQRIVPSGIVRYGMLLLNPTWKYL